MLLRNAAFQTDRVQNALRVRCPGGRVRVTLDPAPNNRHDASFAVEGHPYDVATGQRLRPNSDCGAHLFVVYVPVATCSRSIPLSVSTSTRHRFQAPSLRLSLARG